MEPALWVASGAINTAMGALDQIYQIPIKQRRPFWLAKIIALGLTFGTISLVISASFLAFISDLLIKLALEMGKIPADSILSAWKFFGWILTLAMLAIAFSVVYRFGPSRWRRGTPLLPGAIIGALLWETVSRLFRLYINHFSDYNLTYGTLSAGIVLLLWLNLSSLCMLLGAQLNVTVGKAMNAEDGRKSF